MSSKKTLLFTVVITSLVLMTYQSRKGHIGSMTSIKTILNNAHKAASYMTDSFFRPFRLIALREEENIKLKRRVDELLIERDSHQDTAIENRRLIELLRLKENSRNYVTAARVIARGTGHWEQSLVLDKGQRDGIAKDMTVITPRGLAGKIISVSESFASMLWISDINISVAVRIKETRKEGVLSGTGSRTCILKYVPYEEEVKTGDVIVTSGLDSLFPSGIPVGYASKVDNKGLGGNFQYIEVTPFQDSSRMEEVIIVR
jgi:rod shape-determining protein MreC